MRNSNNCSLFIFLTAAAFFMASIESTKGEHTIYKNIKYIKF